MQTLETQQDSMSAVPEETLRNPKLTSHESGSIHALAVAEMNHVAGGTIQETHSLMKAIVESPLPDTDEDSDVDSRDETPAIRPLHMTAAASAIFRDATVNTTTTTTKSRLTLSAFRRPECTIRLTDSDPARKLQANYDLYAAGCGVIGHGAFSTVRRAVRRKDGVPVAIKSIAKHEALRAQRLRIGGRSYLDEWEILRRFESHPHIITLLDVYETDEEIQLVLEYCKGGELFDAIQKKRNRENSMRKSQYSEPDAACITGQILQALADLHQEGIVHKDVKPENILLGGGDSSDLHVKLCDFGMARPLFRNDDGGNSSDDDVEASPVAPDRTRSFSTLGSDYYVAPEVIFGGKYGTAVDIYSLGVTLYILLCGFPPVFTGDANEVVFPRSYWQDISEDAKSLVRKMLTADSYSRITAREALADRWFRQRIGDGTPELVASNDTRNSSLPENLNLVRTCLFQCLANNHPSSEALAGARKKRRTPPSSAAAVGQVAPARKRPRFQRRRGSTALMALADFYRGVQAVDAIAVAAAAAGVQKPPASQAPPPPSGSNKNQASILSSRRSKDGERSFTASPVKALSV